MFWGLVFFSLSQKKVLWKQNCHGLNRPMKWKRPLQSQKSQRKYTAFYSEETFAVCFADLWDDCCYAVCFDCWPSMGDESCGELFLILHLNNFASGAPVLDDTELHYCSAPIEFRNSKGS